MADLEEQPEQQQTSNAVVLRVEDDAGPDDHRQAWVLAGETHTLGNALRDVMWSHPHVQLASYTQEHPSSADIILRCQTSEGTISAEQGLAEALDITKQILTHVGSSMAAAVDSWVAAHPAAAAGGGGGGRRRAAAAAAAAEEASEEEGSDAMEEDS